MLVLALETSTRHGSAALLRGDRHHACGPLQLIGSTRLQEGQRTASVLLPLVDQLLREHRHRPADIGLIAVATGPGSFTGLRIGVTAAKTLAYAIDCPLTGIHTLAALARGAASDPSAPSGSRLWTLLDAQRQELFTASFRGSLPLGADAPQTQILPIDTWLAQLQPGDQVAGPPLGKLAARLPVGVRLADESCWEPAAAVIGQLGWEALEAGQTVTPWELAPHYYRQSAAEEKADAQRNG